MSATYPLTEKGLHYAQKVVAGEIPACQWIIKACQRHLNDLKKSKRASYPYQFDPMKSERVCHFIEQMPHTKGKWRRTNEPLTLEPWQCFFVSVAFGWVWRESGLRRFRRVVLIVPRKNGKSALAAAIGLYMFAADNEPGAEVYSGATSLKQAHEVFKPARMMAQQTPDFVDWFDIQVNTSSLQIPTDGSKFEPLIGKPGEGASPHLAIIDEYHEHETDALVDAMETGMGAREQPMLLVITTAGDNIAGPCYQLQLDIQKMLNNVIQDDQLFGLIYTIDKEDRWDSMDAVRKANPNFGVSLIEHIVESDLKVAKNSATKQGRYKTRRLDMWVGSRNAYFDIEAWTQKCADPTLKIEDFYGRKAFIGMDLASKIDIAAICILIPLGDNEFVTFQRFYIPEARIEEGVNDKYSDWVKAGWIRATAGNMIDFFEIKDDLVEISKNFELKGLGYDPAQATMLVTALMQEGLTCVEIPQTAARLSEPMKQIDGLIRSAWLHHNDDPVMTWMLSNVVSNENAKGEVYPRKEREDNKIDGPVANIMAMRLAIADDGPDLDDFINNAIAVKYKY